MTHVPGPIGDMLRERAEEIGASELARQIGVTPQAVSLWIDFQREPGRRYISSMASALGVTREVVAAAISEHALKMEARTDRVGAVPDRKSVV